MSVSPSRVKQTGKEVENEGAKGRSQAGEPQPRPPVPSPRGPLTSATALCGHPLLLPLATVRPSPYYPDLLAVRRLTAPQETLRYICLIFISRLPPHRPVPQRCQMDQQLIMTTEHLTCAWDCLKSLCVILFNPYNRAGRWLLLLSPVYK